MKGINRVVISGNVSTQATYGNTAGGVGACSFKMESERRSKQGTVVAAVKINVYGDALVAICQDRLYKGVYVIVEGELMNREGSKGELTEVRAKEIIFVDLKPRSEAPAEGRP